MLAANMRRICTAACALGLLFFACTPRSDQGPDEARNGSVTADTPFSFPQTDLGAQLSRHMELAVGHGEDAEAAYQASLDKLRASAGPAVELLHDSYRSMAEHQYMARWLVVETLRELRSSLALEALYDIARAPIPEELWIEDPHRFSQDEESAIRITAVDGIGLIARIPDRESDKILLEFVRHEDLAVRRTAIRAYLRAGTDFAERERILKGILPATEHNLISIETTNPYTVPHPAIPKKFSLPTDAGHDAPVASGGTKE